MPPGDRRGADSRENGRRPTTGPNQRRNGRPQRPAQAPARPSKRSGDSSEWDSSEWDKLSDVDYWTTLASEKPMSTAMSQRRPERPERPERRPDAPARRPARSGAPRREGGPPGRGRPRPIDADLTAATADFAAAPVPTTTGSHGVKSLLELSDPGGPHTGPSDLPDLSRDMPPAAPPLPPAPPPLPAVSDNDPLTSPGFPRVQDSRSYRSSQNGFRATSDPGTPPNGSPAPAPYSEPTQQLPSYGPSPAQFPSHDAQLTNPYAYPSGPVFQDPYASSSPASTPVPATGNGNPYGSYVTPDSQAGYGGYQEYPPADYQTPEYPGDYQGAANGYSGNGGGEYWNQQATVPGVAGQDTGGYPETNGQDYGNAYAQPDQAAYPPEAYQNGSQDQAGYAPLDPYGPDVYGSYPGYGTPGR
ncbi:MAG TPA: hypothetical protein VH480_24685 [Streptosporangiaceae bacterium]